MLGFKFRVGFWVKRFYVYLEAEGDVVSRKILGITRVTIWLRRVAGMLAHWPEQACISLYGFRGSLRGPK